MLEKLKEIIAEQLGIAADEIKAESNFKDDLGADSLYRAASRARQWACPYAA